MRLAALLSGGKDSIYATYLMMKDGHEIKYLITISPKREDSWMFHFPCIELTKLQSEAMGIMHIFEETEGEKEKELKDLKEILTKLRNEIDGVVSGALASQYQKSRIDEICKELGLESIAPLWRKDQEKILKEECSIFDVIITGVFADGFDESWLGRRLDDKAINGLKKLKDDFGISVVGEGGEFESFVLDGPTFKKRIEIKDFEKKWDNKTNSGYIKVKNAVLTKK